MKKDYRKRLLSIIDGKEYLSDKFNRATNNKNISAWGRKKSPEAWIKIHFKTYPRLNRIKLVKVFQNRKISLVDVLKNRRSSRTFSGKPISIKDLSYLLLYSSGIIDHGFAPDKSRRVYPSAGARYPLEVYPLILSDGDGVKAGLYHYNVKEHILEVILKEDLKHWLLESTGNFKPIIKASVVFIVTGVLDRTRVKYGDRGYRYVLMEAGHMAQNLLLLATGLGMANLAIGGYTDSKVTELLNLELVKEVSLYMIAVGGYV
ncbi:MAG: SagB/ThcOx family dehydrogenase [Candidatus Daviesbacteria bacterium]|nr:SagB/ThcOx family dehydrogenase [Candidatus Daviesbacteria bacterium]